MSGEHLRRIRDGLREHEGSRDAGGPVEFLVANLPKGEVWRLPLGLEWILGRSRKCNLRINAPTVSRKHCGLRFDGERLVLRNLSKRGTLVNGVPVKREQEKELYRGDVFRVGKKHELAAVGVLDPSGPRRKDGELALPQRIDDRYLLLRRVGRGAAGVVFEAWDERKERRCAIKVLTASGGWHHPELVERFKREVTFQGKLSDYPGIVSVWELGTLTDSNELFAVMEFVEGTNLHKLMKRGLPLVEGVRILSRVARAVDYAHQRGLVHRDLKPGNIMVSRNGNARLTDFGIAKALEDQDESLTMTGATLGTPHYMAPEQIDDSKRVGLACDIWALGVMLYKHMTGQVPFPTPNIADIFDLVAKGDFPAPIELDPSLPVELNALCLRAMNLDPEGRPPAKTFAKDLEDWSKRIDPPKRVSLMSPDMSESDEHSHLADSDDPSADDIDTSV